MIQRKHDRTFLFDDALRPKYFDMFFVSSFITLSHEKESHIHQKENLGRRKVKEPACDRSSSEMNATNNDARKMFSFR